MGLTTRRQHENKALTSSQMVTIQVPSEGKIQSLPLYFTASNGAAVTEAQIRAEITNIRLTLNGTDIVNCSPIQLLDAYESLGGARVGVPAAVAGVVELLVGKYIFASTEGRDAYGLGTADVPNIQISVTAGTLSAIANVQAYSEIQPVTQNLGMHPRVISYPRSFNSAAVDTVDTLPRDIDSAYIALLVDDGASGTITYGEVILNSYNVQQLTPSAIAAQYASNRGNQQVSGYYFYDFSDGGITTYLPMLGATYFAIKNTFSVAPGAAGYNVLAITMNGIPQPKVA